MPVLLYDFVDMISYSFIYYSVISADTMEDCSESEDCLIYSSQCTWR